MQALQDAGAYGGAPLLAVQQELLGKQMQSFGKTMALLRDRMCASKPQATHHKHLVLLAV